MMDFVVRAIRMARSGIFAVASGYADFRRFGGVSYADVVRAAKDAKADVVMVDTAIKDGKNLFDAMTLDEIKEFTQLGHDAGLLVALAGSVQQEHLEALAGTGCDIVGIRGAVCDVADRTRGIIRERVEAFMAHARSIAPSPDTGMLDAAMSGSAAN